MDGDSFSTTNSAAKYDTEQNDRSSTKALGIDILVWAGIVNRVVGFTVCVVCGECGFRHRRRRENSTGPSKFSFPVNESHFAIITAEAVIKVKDTSEKEAFGGTDSFFPVILYLSYRHSS